MTDDLDIKKAYIENLVAEFGRVAKGLVLLINEEEVKSVSAVVESMLLDCWTTAQKPLLEALVKQL